MSQIAFIQARISSKRLPGKVLAQIAGKPLLAYLVERLRYGKSLNGIIVLTSSASDDDAIASYCEESGTRCFRGSLNDVLGRFLAAAAEFKVSSFVRVNGDSPLLDPRLIDQGVSLFESASVDLVSNAFPRSFPKGQSVEVISVEALRKVAAESRDPQDHEHVTPYFYVHHDRFRIRNFSSGKELQSIQMSVDAPADLKKVEGMISQMDKPHWTYGLDELLVLEQRFRSQ